MYSSLLDEIVQPQAGNSALGILKDAREVGVMNDQIQVICSGKPAGIICTHEGALFNSLTSELAKEALTHDRPGRKERLDLGEVCGKFAADSLSLVDALATEGLIPLAGANILLLKEKTFSELPLRSYAK